MGAVNYYTSDYITLAVRPYNMDDEMLKVLREEIAEYGNPYETEQQYIDQYISDCYSDDYINIKSVLDRYNLYYYEIDIEPGYYEGFSLKIKLLEYYDVDDLTQAAKEIPEVIQCLKECVKCGMVACYPGWCTAYFNHDETLTKIDEAADKMLEELKKLKEEI